MKRRDVIALTGERSPSRQVDTAIAQREIAHTRAGRCLSASRGPPAAWSDYVYWQGQDRETLKRVNALIQDAMRQPFNGIGKPDPLRENLSGFWSRRIDDVNRLVYAVDGPDLAIVSCRYHYD